jgi:hypothetical protein
MSLRAVRAAVAIAMVAVTSTAFAPLAFAASTAVPGRAQAPALSIQLTDNRDTVEPNATVHQVLTLTNTGSAPVTGLLVVTAPPYASIANAPGADVSGSEATWTVTAAPGAPLTEELDVGIGQVPAGEQFVTTLATFYAGGNRTAPPTVRTADADRLPGVPDPRSTTTSTRGSAAAANHPASKTSGWVTVAAVAGTIVVVSVLGAIAVAVRRRRAARIGS